MIHRILGYLWYKSRKIIPEMSVNGPLIFGVVFMLYEACFGLAYWLITGISPSSYFGSRAEYLICCFGIFIVQLIAIEVYYRYKCRYWKIEADKSYEEYSGIWAALFLLFPFVSLIALALIF